MVLFSSTAFAHDLMKFGSPHLFAKVKYVKKVNLIF